MTDEKKPVIFQGSGYRVVRNDPRNVKLQVVNEEGKYRDNGYFQTIAQALAQLVTKDLIVDEDTPHGFDSYLETIEETRKTIIKDIEAYFQNGVDPEETPTSDDFDDDDLFKKKLKRIEENNMAKLLNDSKLITNKVRLSFTHVFQPASSFEGQEEKYSTTIMIPKDDEETLKILQKAEKNVFEAEKSGKLKGTKLGKFKNTLIRDGDEDFDLDKYPEYADHWIVSTSSKQKPVVIDKYKEEITDESEVYSGVYARVQINLFAYNNKSKGIAAGLNAVQVVAKGEPFASHVDVDDFEEYEDDSDDDDLM